ncbi:DUF4386 family protein [Actinomadura macrotermitis]|uniref:DUF4386 family protein n=1 Tax=Actinomadura macrotermitis TaxID=2585200 RepID=A0A7K0C2W0_9ACTN|nr:DUF4386 family protein [Actinomadura macrotermitis]MQY07771.1 hypothetical protein [Actinomadura macrotermitis]
MHERSLAAALAGGVVAANAAFIGLGSVFDYPAVLHRPAGEVLARFAADSTAISGFFLLLALGAGLLIPASVLLGRRLGSAAVTCAGVLAGLVQLLGLLRWPFAVPALADAHPADPRTTETVFTALNDYLGVAVGETLGYLFTAAWTLLVLRALDGAPRWFTGLGAVSAAAVAAGAFGAAQVNFAGYLGWSVWMLALAVLILRDRGPVRIFARNAGTPVAGSSEI